MQGIRSNIHWRIFHSPILNLEAHPAELGVLAIRGDRLTAPAAMGGPSRAEGSIFSCWLSWATLEPLGAGYVPLSRFWGGSMPKVINEKYHVCDCGVHPCITVYTSLVWVHDGICLCCFLQSNHEVIHDNLAGI